jgi:hypothetical protein
MIYKKDTQKTKDEAQWTLLKPGSEFGCWRRVQILAVAVVLLLNDTKII